MNGFYFTAKTQNLVSKANISAVEIRQTNMSNFSARYGARLSQRCSKCGPGAISGPCNDFIRPLTTNQE